MKKYFLIGEAAKMVNMTSETLRHYDRIDLVKPSKYDEQSKYRYYTQQDIIRLNAVRALQMMDLPLQKIKTVLEYNDLEKIIKFLTEAEKNADEKIETLQYSKSKIQLAKADYERKLKGRQNIQNNFVYNFPERVIMLSDTMETPTLDNLWNYLSHFYDKFEPSLKEQFAFEDLAGIYTENGISRLFAVCIRHADIEGLKILPGGKYLCSYCTEENRKIILDKLIQTANEKYNIKPKFTIQQIVVSGILQWNYQAQIYLG